MDAYTTTKYTRLQFDKYIESNRASDKVAAMLTNREPTLIHLGGAQTPPNSPIKIKKTCKSPWNTQTVGQLQEIG